MELINGRWRCKLCHEEIDAPLDAKPIAAIETRGGEMSCRVIRDGITVVHTCAAGGVIGGHYASPQAASRPSNPATQASEIRPVR
jgi:hypothetical protein